MLFNLEPVKHDKLGKKIAEYDVRDFYEKLAEELMEAHTAAIELEGLLEVAYPEAIQSEIEAEIGELLDLMTACATRIHALKLTDKRLSELQAAIIEKNKARGYFIE